MTYLLESENVTFCSLKYTRSSATAEKQRASL